MGDKKGSALLIVLGMFAFMLVSAVAFSVYMRASRAPSSYLLRNATLRQVVKAAVARAIDEVDTAIGNDPFPGVGYNHDYGGSGSMGMGTPDYKNDTWRGRVFTPGGETNMSATVSTLTLEALGYLPPSLINEARYWSRHTRTATWHAFNYGLGRYAFTAVNVSDFFDLNQLITGDDGVRRPYLNRNSSPHGRISITSLFRGDEQGRMDSGGPLAAAFLSAIATGSGLGNTPSLSQVPFVSMMDYNLAIGNNALGGFASPFNRLIMQNNNSTLYSGMDQVAARQVFMAGGWNSESNLTYEAYDNTGRINLRYPQFQPFSKSDWFPFNTTLQHCYDDVPVSHPFWSKVNDNFPIISTAMLCGVELADRGVKYSVKLNEEELQAANAEQGTKKKIKRTYSFHLEIDSLETTLTAVYPFRNGPQGQNEGKTYRPEAFVRVFFAAESDLGDGDLKDGRLRTGISAFGADDEAQWTRDDNTRVEFLQAKCDTSKTIDTKIPAGVGEAAEKDAIQNDIAFMSGGVVKDVMLAELVYEVDENGGETLVEAECKNGTDFNFYDSAWNTVNFLDEIKNDAHPDLRYRPSVAVYARIKSGNKTVDMVPAIATSDRLNGFADNKNINGFDVASGEAAGVPLLRFYAKKADDAYGVRLTKAYFKDNSDAMRDNVEWKQKAYIANDPRINWAPEQWWATDNGGDPKDLWFDNVKTFQNREDSASLRDTDIFMASSDQGYLQSMYEWLLIPQVRELFDTTNPEWGAFENGGYNGIARDAIGNVAYGNVMWRTYKSRAFVDGATVGNWGLLDNLPFDEAENGLRVNPYTDNTNIMLCAFANMPNGWWAAGTNTTGRYSSEGQKGYMDQGGVAFEKRYLFDWSYEYEDVRDMATFWMSVFRQKEANRRYRADDWRDFIDGYSDNLMDILNWRTGHVLYNTTENHGLEAQDILQNDMCLADRKYLYGFLKGCFANPAQLFLIFVNAETTAGGAAGSGARAVALVSPDPAPAKDASGQFKKADGGSETPGENKDNARQYLRPYNSGAPEESWRFRPRDYPPHRTRILFYHQFD